MRAIFASTSAANVNLVLNITINANGGSKVDFSEDSTLNLLEILIAADTTRRWVCTIWSEIVILVGIGIVFVTFVLFFFVSPEERIVLEIKVLDFRPCRHVYSGDVLLFKLDAILELHSLFIQDKGQIILVHLDRLVFRMRGILKVCEEVR